MNLQLGQESTYSLSYMISCFCQSEVQELEAQHNNLNFIKQRFSVLQQQLADFLTLIKFTQTNFLQNKNTLKKAIHNYNISLEKISIQLGNNFNLAVELGKIMKVDIAYNVISKKNYEDLPLVLTQKNFRISQFNLDHYIKFDKNKEYMSEIGKEIRKEIELKLLESEMLPKFAKIDIKQGTLKITVKNIELMLGLYCISEHQYDWYVKDYNIKGSWKEIVRKSGYNQLIFIFFENIIKNIAENKQIDQNYKKEYLISFICHCVWEIEQLLIFLKLKIEDKISNSSFKFVIDNDFKLSILYNKNVYEIKYVMPKDTDFLTFLDRTKYSSVMSVINFEEETGIKNQIFIFIEDFYVNDCNTIYHINGHKIQNNLYTDEPVFKEINRQYISKKIKEAEELKSFYRELTKLSQDRLVQEHDPTYRIVLKLNETFIFAEEGSISKKLGMSKDFKQAQKAFLIVYVWCQKEIFVYVDISNFTCYFSKQQINVIFDRKIDRGMLREGLVIKEDHQRTNSFELVNVNHPTTLKLIKYNIIKNSIKDSFSNNSYKLSRYDIKIEPMEKIEFEFIHETKKQRNQSRIYIFIFNLLGPIKRFGDVKVECEISPVQTRRNYQFHRKISLEEDRTFEINLFCKKLNLFFLHANDFLKLDQFRSMSRDRQRNPVITLNFD